MTASPDRSSSIWHFAKYHLPAIVYALLILSVSAVPNLSIPSIKVVSIDKVAHFMEYAVFALLVFRSFAHMGVSASRLRALWLSVFFLVVFAAADEAFQQLIPGRHSDIWDLVVDLAGGWLVCVFLYVRRSGLSKTMT